MEKVRKSLIAQLKEKGLDEEKHAYDFSLVDDYMILWTTKEKLKEDIEERGVTVEWKNSEESKGIKQNDSVLNLNRVSAQMLKILNHLQLRPPAEAMRGDEDEIPATL